MPKDTPPDGMPPRIVVALPPGPDRDRLMALLRERDVDVGSLPHVAGLEEIIDEAESDVVVVRRQDLTPADRRHLHEAAEDSGRADVVVLESELDEAAHVDLVASGAAEVVDATQLDVAVVDALETLAAGEGGHATPDQGAGAEPSLSDFASRTKRMHQLLDLVRRIAPTDSALLLTGETGVGKEHLARAIHAASPRREAPFVAVNCGALPEELLESELFGHVAGAFTGARGARKGCFQSAEGGSLLLDEIGEMPRHLQVKLLRALQRGEVRPVGADEDVRLDVRIMAATNRDLRKEVDEGLFREDLYYRLNVVEVEIPPLRDRPEDLPTLIGSLLRHFRGRSGAHDIEGIDERALEALLEYEWPGNVRELINALERAVLVCRGRTIGVGDLPRHVVAPLEGDDGREFGELPPDLVAGTWSEARAEALRLVERRYLEAVLTECEGVVGATAERAGLSPRSLYEKMRRHGLRKEDFR